ncbi:MAG: hypothetical protein O9267_01340 [Flavobacterium sp.]|uniref:hypothetical protein n=1 Tax=Flavobacterium sp. TaxID=239 RepID=UPI0022C9407F|nr:hypothetical protein [Flavobacterium sp.]MCZ8196232.1 hypothetical protein [Flavobacterium sp.]
MSVAAKKLELIKWLTSVEDKTVINQLDNYRKQQHSFDFKKELETAISADELKKRTTTFLKSLEWKK